MDLFKYHKQPEELHGHHERDDIVIERFWDVVVKNKKATSKQEESISKDPHYSYMYAKYIIKGRWPKGEESISKDPQYSCLYAKDIIKGRWPRGEDAIAKNDTDPPITKRTTSPRRRPVSTKSILVSLPPSFSEGSVMERLSIKHIS
jgi:hypothetical protein